MTGPAIGREAEQRLVQDLLAGEGADSRILGRRVEADDRRLEIDAAAVSQGR